MPLKHANLIVRGRPSRWRRSPCRDVILFEETREWFGRAQHPGSSRTAPSSLITWRFYRLATGMNRRPPDWPRAYECAVRKPLPMPTTMLESQEATLRCFHAAAPLKPLHDSRVLGVSPHSPLLSRSGPIEAQLDRLAPRRSAPLRCFHAAAPLKRGFPREVFQLDATLRCFHAAAPLKPLRAGLWVVSLLWLSAAFTQRPH